MKLSTLRKYRRRHRFFRDLGYDNPALILGVNLPFVVGTAFSLKNAAAISLQMLLIHPLTVMVARVLTARLPSRYRAMVSVCVSTVMMLISREIVMALFPGIANSVGVYLYLMGVNGMTLMQAAARPSRRGPGQALARVLLDVSFFTLLMFAVSLAREIFGNGTVWGIALPLPVKLSGVQLPFFGFILTGMVLAMLRVSRRQLAALRLSSAERRDAAYIEIDRPVGPALLSDYDLPGAEPEQPSPGPDDAAKHSKPDEQDPA